MWITNDINIYIIYLIYYYITYDNHRVSEGLRYLTVDWSDCVRELVWADMHQSALMEVVVHIEICLGLLNFTWAYVDWYRGVTKSMVPSKHGTKGFKALNQVLTMLQETLLNTQRNKFLLPSKFRGVWFRGTDIFLFDNQPNEITFGS